MILVDADACPVKEEIYKVAFRRKVAVAIYANSYMRVPEHGLISRIAVDDKFDAADDAIVARADAKALVVTADILLAERCLKKGAAVLSPNGKPFTADSIGAAVATRAILSDLRAGANIAGAGGPPPFSKADRSRFLSALDEMLTQIQRAQAALSAAKQPLRTQ